MPEIKTKKAFEEHLKFKFAQLRINKIYCMMLDCNLFVSEVTVRLPDLSIIKVKPDELRLIPDEEQGFIEERDLAARLPEKLKGFLTERVE